MELELYMGQLKKKHSRNNEMEEELDVLKDEYLKAGLSLKTAETYNYGINIFLNWLGDRDITLENGELFLLEKKKAGRSKNTLSVIRTALNFYFDDVLEEGTLEFKTGKIRRKLPIILTKSEIKLLLENTHSIDLKIAIEIILSSGIRLDELFNLRFIDLDLDNLRLKVNNGKGDKERTTVIGPEVREDLIKYYPKMLKTTDLIVRFSKRVFRASLKDIAKKVGIQKNIYPHLLRHCFGTYHYKQFKDIVLLSKLMGHESIEMTKIYITLSGEDIKEAKSPNYG